MKKLLPILVLCLYINCKQNNKKNYINQKNIFQFATGIQCYKKNDNLVVKSNQDSVLFLKNELPVKKIMVVPTASLAFLSELNAVQNVTGISEPDFVFNPEILKAYKNKKIVKIGSYNDLYYETIMSQKPDVLISTANPILAKVHESLKKQGIKIIYLDDYKEKTPLGKAEYLKLFGLLLNKNDLANEKFETIKSEYNQIKDKLKNAKNKPTVLANGMYGDVWYMPPGNSFQAVFFKDASANFLWQNQTAENTLNLTFEQVYTKAKTAEIWINAGDFPNLESFAASNQKYKWFDAFKNKKVYNWGKRKNTSGANDYFESGVVHPEKILNDLAAIFHPEIFGNEELYFYQKLN